MAEGGEGALAVSPSSLLAVLESESPCITGTKPGVQVSGAAGDRTGQPQPHPDLLFCDKRGISHL